MVSDAETNLVSAHVRPPWWFRLVRALLNLALLSLLCLQAFLVVILWTNNHLGLPGFVRHALEDRLQDQGLSVRFRHLEVSLSGRLLLREPQIYLTGARDPIAEADILEIDPDWVELWWGRQFTFSEARLINANFYCPPESSPSGVREAFIQHLDAALSSQGHRWWRLDHLHAQFLKADIEARGTFLWPPLAAATTTASGPLVTKPAGVAEQTLAGWFRQWAGAVVSLQPQVARVGKPVVQINLAGEEPGRTIIHAKIMTDGVRPLIAGLVLGKGWVQGSFVWNGHVLRATAPVEGRTQSIHYTRPTVTTTAPMELFTTGQAWASVQPADGSDGVWGGRPGRIRIAATTVSAGDFPVDVLIADFDLRQWPRLSLEAFATQGSESLKLGGLANIDVTGAAPDLRDGQFDFHAQVGVPTLLTAGHWKLPSGLESLSFEGALRLDGQIALTPGHEIDFVKGEIHADGAHFQGINLDQVSARGRLIRETPGNYSLDLSQISLLNRSWRVDGAYFEDFLTHDFRLLAQGNIDPQVLKPYMGDWWQPLWQFIVPQGKWPQADVEFSGNWGGPWWVNQLFVYTQITGAQAQGVPTDSIRARVRLRPEYIAVYDIAAHATGGGDLTGAMVWPINPSTSRIYEQRYFFNSSLPVTAVGALAGPEVAAVLRPLDCPVPPIIQVDQRTRFSINPEPDAVVTKIHGEFASPFHLFNVPLDQATISVTDEAGNIDIPQLVVGMAGGKALAEGAVTNLNGSSRLKFNLLLQDAHQADFLAALGQFDAAGGAPQLASNPNALNSTVVKDKNSMLGGLDHPGLLDLTLGGWFVFDQPDSLLAAGQVRIHDAQLGQLQLFGRMSKLLADTKVPLGDFTLHSAQSDLQIANQYLRLPNLVVTGPSARIQAAGVYHFSDGELNFNTLIFPIGEWDTFLLKQIASMANPFVNTVTLKLHGNIEKPAWEISMNPMRLFENRTVEGPSIPGIAADADGGPVLPSLPLAPPLPDLPKESR